MNKKLALIVGGTGGIGDYIVHQFSASEFNVCFTYNTSSGKSHELEAVTSARGYKLDVTQEDDVKKFFTNIHSGYGRLDAVIYVAGIFEDGIIDNVALESWNKVLSVNLTGAFVVTKYALPLLRENGNGRILYAGSVMGESGIYGSASYSVTKAGLIALAKSVGLENAMKNVTANVVSFGYIDAGMTNRVSEKILDSAIKRIPMHRLGSPEDTAKVIVDLCSDHTNYISGQVIRINGMLYV